MPHSPHGPPARNAHPGAATVTERRRALVVEDDRDIARLVGDALRAEGFAVRTVHDGIDGLTEALDPDTELVVLDLLLPGMDGLEVCRRLRARRPDVLVLMLTAKADELDRVLGLEIGADDYLTKPFSLRELQARAKALRRRKQALSDGGGSGRPIQAGPLTIDVVAQTVRLRGRDVSLTQREFELLAHFVRHPGRVFAREELLDAVWGAGFGGYAHTDNSHINRLRAKIEEDPGEPRMVQTVWGRGYRFVVPDDG